MLELFFTILMIGIFGKLLIFSFKATWGITKILFTIVFLPIILILMVLAGLVSLALPILLVIGVIALVCTKADI